MYKIISFRWTITARNFGHLPVEVLWKRYGMRYEGDINTAQQKKIIMPRGDLNDNAPDSELSRQGFEFTNERQILIFT